jgi:predicted NACHT family NTPase
MAVGEAAAGAMAAKVLESAAEPILKCVGTKLSLELSRIRVQFTKTFQQHLASSIHRAQFVKTVTSKDKPVDIKKIYVNLSLRNEDNEYFADLDLNPCSDHGRRIITSGTGDAGKTILMKYLLLLAVENKNGFVPLFIELRNLDFSKKDGNLQSSIYEHLSADIANTSKSLFTAALEEGLFAIFLDGFDEINPEFSDRAIKWISLFSQKYQKCSIIISTRPGTGVHALVDFSVFHLNPLSKEQAIELVSKTKFEDSSKRKFLQALEKELYERHQTMMSLPILIVMMLLTFRSYGDIPDRMTVFYSQAFETLYSIHDAEGKESYKRVHESGLPPDIFRRVLNSFCYSSLCKYEIEFTRESLELYAEKALRLAQAQSSVKDFLSDLIKNVCILQPEGTSYTFVHPFISGVLRFLLSLSILR